MVDREAWCAAVPGVTKSWKWLSYRTTTAKWVHKQKRSPQQQILERAKSLQLILRKRRKQSFFFYMAKHHFKKYKVMTHSNIDEQVSKCIFLLKQTTLKNFGFTESSREEIHRNMMCACAVRVCVFGGGGCLCVFKWEINLLNSLQDNTTVTFGSSLPVKRSDLHFYQTKICKLAHNLTASEL